MKYPSSEAEWRTAATAAAATLQIHAANRAGIDERHIVPGRQRLARTVLRRAAARGIHPDPIDVFEILRATVAR